MSKRCFKSQDRKTYYHTQAFDFIAQSSSSDQVLFLSWDLKPCLLLISLQHDSATLSMLIKINGLNLGDVLLGMITMMISSSCTYCKKFQFIIIIIIIIIIM